MADSSKGKAGTAGRGAAELRALLLERERQLAELTEHSLGILDQLTSARVAVADRVELRRRVAQLEELLTETRTRIRAAGNIVLAQGEAAAQVPAELVVWDVAADDRSRLLALLAVDAGMPVTLLLRRGVAAAALALPARPGLAVQETELTVPAQFWNQALATTHAEVVVCLWAGGALAATALAALTAAVGDGVALASPVLGHDAERWLGGVETGFGVDTPVPAASGKEPIVPLAFAAAEAFAIGRAAFHQLGLFDQDLATSGALAEWTLRARAAAWKVLGVRAAVAELQTTLELTERAADRDGRVELRDRLLTLARHQSQQLVATVLASPRFWELSPDAVAELTRAAFVRLPQAAMLPAAVDLLVHQAVQMARGSVPVPLLRRQLAQLEQVLESTLDLGAGNYSQALQQLVQKVHDSVRGADQSIRDMLDRLAQEAAVAHDAKHQLEEQLRGQTAAGHELQAELLARAGQVSALQEQLLAGERAQTQLATRAQALTVTIQDRDRWITALLGELRQRRLFPRQLLAHEQQFLQDHGGSGGR